MNYKENHLLNWFNDHPCINISCVEKHCSIKPRNLNYFVKKKRRLGVDEFNRIENYLLNYGYIEYENK